MHKGGFHKGRIIDKVIGLPIQNIGWVRAQALSLMGDC